MKILTGGRTPCLLDPILVPLGLDKFWSEEGEQQAPADAKEGAKAVAPSASASASTASSEEVAARE